MVNFKFKLKDSFGGRNHHLHKYVVLKLYVFSNYVNNQCFPDSNSDSRFRFFTWNRWNRFFLKESMESNRNRKVFRVFENNLSRGTKTNKEKLWNRNQNRLFWGIDGIESESIKMESVRIGVESESKKMESGKHWFHRWEPG